MKPCVFFDRDGIVNVSPGLGYVERWADFHLMPGFTDVLRVCRECGFEAVIATNQQGVGRGIMPWETLEEIHRNLTTLLRNEYGLELTGIVACLHKAGTCECRKPKPGLLLEAATRYGLDLERSWMIGDSETDVEAGRAAGCRTIRVVPAGQGTRADYRVADLKELKTLIEKVLPLG